MVHLKAVNLPAMLSEVQDTSVQYDSVIKDCKKIFEQKMIDYGSAWRILRPSSLTDQLFIKASRIRTIQETGAAKVDEGIATEFIGLVNYSVMALVQLALQDDENLELPMTDALNLYDEQVEGAKNLMERKNHDYGEAWRDMRISSLTDLILMKILRIKQIEDNEGETLISEGVDAGYQDMINYAVFALIKINFPNEE